jgi:hypothetical protein
MASAWPRDQSAAHSRSWSASARPVLGRQQADIADVLYIVPFQAETICNPRREIRVDEEPQAG